MDSTTEISDSTCQSFLNLTQEIHTALVRSEEHAKATHERFNVFSTLLKEGDEVRLHTRFLHCLLDPQGTHDCGSLFLNLFLQTLKDLQRVVHDKNLVKCPIPVDEQRWTVSKEASRAEYGQIDLLMESHAFGIAIENKIYAGEQSEQLLRYRNYLHGRYGDSFCLLYLTLDGKQSFTAGEHEYYRVSYKDHILSWLDLCLRETYHIIPINQALIQYRAVVRRLTNQNLESEFMKPVIDLIRENPEIIRYNDSIQEAVRQVSYAAWKELKECIKSTFANDYEISFHKEKNWGVDSDAAVIFKPRAGSGLFDLNFPVWIEPDFINPPTCLGIGICVDEIALEDHMIATLEKVHFDMKKLPRYGFHNPKNGKPRFPVGWRNLMEGTYAEQSAQLLSKVKIQSICEDIRDYLEKLKKSISNAKHDFNTL